MGVSVEELTSEQKELLLNGCGPEENVWGWWDPPDLIFKEACDNHDLAYRIGGHADMADVGQPQDSTDRYMADLAFYGEMKKLAAKQSWWKRWWYMRAARLYFELVTTYGQPYFVYRERGRARFVTVEDLVREEHIRQAIGEPDAGSPCCRCREDAGHF